MKKLLICLLVILLAGLLLVGCSGGNGEIVEIEDRFFLTQVNHIRRNADDYVGRTIRYEGMFETFHWPATGDFYMVFRHTRGCCGDDGIVGYEVYLGDIEPFAPNTWVEVVGVLEWYEVDDLSILRVVATSITELAERGQELVLQ
ncbi:MAG: hypothetical protein FWC72_04380 [Oscillospiraceae bacterium]|nr:hypothetical protein [Oscillospiraceae bacterium]